MSNFFGDAIRGTPTVSMRNVAPSTDPATLKPGTPVKQDANYLIIPCPANELNNMIGIVHNDSNDAMLAGHIASGKLNIAIGGDALVNVRLAAVDQTPVNLAKIGLNVESVGHTDFLENDCKATGEGIRVNLGALTNPNQPPAELAK